MVREKTGSNSVKKKAYKVENLGPVSIVEIYSDKGLTVNKKPVNNHSIEYSSFL